MAIPETHIHQQANIDHSTWATTHLEMAPNRTTSHTLPTGPNQFRRATFGSSTAGNTEVLNSVITRMEILMMMTVLAIITVDMEMIRGKCRFNHIPKRGSEISAIERRPGA
jgi:hypothetical protein